MKQTFYGIRHIISQKVLCITYENLGGCNANGFWNLECTGFGHMWHAEARATAQAVLNGEGLGIYIYRPKHEFKPVELEIVEIEIEVKN